MGAPYGCSSRSRPPRDCRDTGDERADQQGQCEEYRRLGSRLARRIRGSAGLIGRIHRAGEEVIDPPLCLGRGHAGLRCDQLRQIGAIGIGHTAAGEGVCDDVDRFDARIGAALSVHCRSCGRGAEQLVNPVGHGKRACGEGARGIRARGIRRGVVRGCALRDRTRASGSRLRSGVHPAAEQRG